MNNLTMGGLFAGIGGFELAATWANITPIWSNEIDPFCCKVLRKNFTHEIIEEDIRKIGGENLKPVDIICGGFPCQPFSSAGKRKGANDDRYLWPEMLRVVSEVQPTWVIGENVAGITNMVQPGKEIIMESQTHVCEEAEMVTETIRKDLQGIGYNTEFLIIPACALGAPHRRDRLWIVAHSNGCAKESPRKGKKANRTWCDNTNEQKGGQKSSKLDSGWGDVLQPSPDTNSESPRMEKQNTRRQKRGFTNTSQSEVVRQGYGEINAKGFTTTSSNEDASDSNGKGLQRGKEQRGTKKDWTQSHKQPARRICSDWENFPTQPPVRGRNDGISRRMDRNRIKALGNAIVPQVAYQIFKGIVEVEKAYLNQI